MSRNNKNLKTKTELNENDLMDMILNNDSEDFKSIQFHSIKATNMKKIKFFKNNVEMNESEIEEFIPFNRLKRSNSVDIYKKRKEKKLKKNQDKSDISNINIIENDKNEFKNGKKIKKVSFLKPKFVTIIDVESYKKFNMENTSKDPMDFLFNNNNNINGNNNNNNFNNNNKNEEDKEKVVCSCYIF